MTLVGLIVQWVLMMQTSSKLFSEPNQPGARGGMASEISGPPHIDIHNEDRWSKSEETPSAM